MLAFITALIWTTDYSGLSTQHLWLVASATLLVGFCEEMTTRGVLLVALRGSSRSETSVWLGSCGLFGLLHAINGLFGVGALALLQVLLTFFVGTGLYLLRRFSGTLLLPMLIHAAWDFSTLASGLDSAPAPGFALLMMGATYVLSIALVVVVLHQSRSLQARNEVG
ncbi:CPBP family intramembrane glutamic endopeptidase [Stenotrophomonas cyclobalanopsidis]|uniref:CPBP family intramembrane glutamic endopeptidase n=1 Tax=Stenotrophomonas cyclobalanopsidis TaxID=2771362 RepID=UPI0028AF2772|nr:CPBP family intramembrane glutamic endopeptidase [Stenotrophomonas cyclobalanopsidis]